MPAHLTVPGSPRSPVVLHVPHGARHVPDAVRAGIVLDNAELVAELDRMTDTDTGLIARRAAQATTSGPWIFENRASRLVVDPERFPDEREEMRAVGMGAVYTRTSQGTPLRHPDPEQEQALLDEYFTPYADAIAELVDDRLTTTGRAVILDVHSYPSKPLPYELHTDGTRPSVCIGTDVFHTPDWLLDAARTAFEPCGDVALNTPFAGCYVPLRHYGTNASVVAVMIEIRRDTYLTEPAGPPTPRLGNVAAALARLVDRIDSRLSLTEHS
ncbi:MAG TPA: N-formylglutamate amidohydrolase [Actinocrinis sp.]|uniref:N-formylglutamate amidohydrolase n=1 Tax=Actinocrinis sp. TaxID=1920516 RepID=UPI002DDDA025|nr:N-formylglutamate amidohydrolase [Actinocrinis sp.]HEV2344077.1 N-formylglutamate amidohydrolase [Actinocrinis sp.]